MRVTIKDRAGRLYLHYRANNRLCRVATGIKNTPDAWKYIQNKAHQFIEDKIKAKAKFLNWLDDRVMEKLWAEDGGAAAWESIQAASNYFKDIKTGRINTDKNIESVERGIIDFFIKHKIKKIGGAAACGGQLFVRFFKNKNNSNQTIKYKSGFYKRFLNDCVNRGMLEKHNFKLPHLPYEASRTQDEIGLSYEKIKEIIKNASPAIRDYLMVAFFTGARLGEIRGLKVEDCDFSNNIILIRRTRLENGEINSPKTRTSHRNIDMLPQVKKILMERIGRLGLLENSFVFEIAPYNLRKEWYKTLQKVGMKPMRIYATRHSFASLMLEKGEELEWVSRIMLGHKNPATTLNRYGRLIKKHISVRATFIKSEDFSGGGGAGEGGMEAKC